MISSGFFLLFVFLGIAGAWVTFLFCIWVSVKEYRSGTLWRSRD